MDHAPGGDLEVVPGEEQHQEEGQHAEVEVPDRQKKHLARVKGDSG